MVKEKLAAHQIIVSQPFFSWKLIQYTFIITQVENVLSDNMHEN